LLKGFRPSCDPTPYFHTQAPTDPIFHSVVGSECRLNPARAEQAMAARAGGNLSNLVQMLQSDLAKAQDKLQCCQPKLCQAAWQDACQWELPPPRTCTLNQGLPSCLARHPKSGMATQVQLGGALRIASTFAEILLLQYANGFELHEGEVGWQVSPDEMMELFRLHAVAFDLEQRTPYVAALQGSGLLHRILLALTDESDTSAGVAPAGARFVAFVGHDTNIANIGGMLELSWQQPGYQKDQMPPAGALTFEVREEAGTRRVYVAYVAQSLKQMRSGQGDSPVRTPVRVPGCSTTEPGFPCGLDRFKQLVAEKLDPDCAR
jgi:4-phytase/acid phosphatase